MGQVFGRAEVSADLTGFPAGQQESRVAALSRLLSTPPSPETNTVLVSHGFNIANTANLAITEGEAAIFARSATELSIGHNVSSKAEVDALMEQAKKAGAVIVKAAHDTFWGGYAGYFQDPDGHLWEVAWNPQWVLDD